jgi:geranylgeranyl diphosphate synthase type I
MNVKKELRAYQQQVDKHIQKFLNQKVNEYSKTTKFSGEMTQNFSDYIMRGGKRLRAALMYYTYKMAGNKISSDSEFKKLSSFIEFIHAFFLVHDDIMDRDSLRRGGVTVHRQYEEIGEQLKFKDQKHFGTSMGILVGDMSCQLAYKIIADSKIPDFQKIEIIKIVTERVNSTIFGQAHDILLAYKDSYDTHDIHLVQKLKTALYTFDTPVFIGATLGGASKKCIKDLNGYTIPAGIAFQVRDDILGMFGEKEKTGKSANSDLKEGKRTHLIHYALAKAGRKQTKLIETFLGKDDLEQDEADVVREIVVDTGALDHSIKLTGEYIDKALYSLGKLKNKRSKGWKFLEAIAKYMVVREV